MNTDVQYYVQRNSEWATKFFLSWRPVILTVVLVPQEDSRPLLRLPVWRVASGDLVGDCAAEYGSVRCASVAGAVAYEGPVVQTDAWIWAGER